MQRSSSGSFVVVIAVGVCALLGAGPSWAQVTGDDDSPLRQRQHLDAMQLSLQPPRYWSERVVGGATSVTYTGPGEDGVFPRIDLVAVDGVVDLSEDRAVLRSRVRVQLLERGADIQLLDEMDTMVGDRTVLEESYTFTSNQRPMTALVYHFVSGSMNYTFLYTHTSRAFDGRLDLVNQVFGSIVTESEKDTLASDLGLGFLLVAGLVYGGYYAFKVARTAVLKKTLVDDVAVLERSEASRGVGELVIGDDEGDLEAPLDEETGFKILDLSKRSKNDRDSL